MFSASLSKVHWTFFTFVICHIAWVLCFVGTGVGFCPDSIRARPDSVRARLDSVCVQKDTHPGVAVNIHSLVGGALVFVLAQALTSPTGEGPTEGVGLFVAEEEGNLVGGEAAVVDVVAREAQACGVELPLEGGALVGKAALEGALAEAEMVGGIGSGAEPQRKQL